MDNATKAPGAKSIFESIKGYFTDLSKKMNLSKEKLLDIALYLVLGVLSGFLLKRFFKYVVFFGIFIGGMFILRYYGVMTFAIDWDKVHDVLGIQTIGKIDGNILSVIWAWIRANVIIFISFVIGFIIGWKIG